MKGGGVQMALAKLNAKKEQQAKALADKELRIQNKKDLEIERLNAKIEKQKLLEVDLKKAALAKPLKSPRKLEKFLTEVELNIINTFLSTGDRLSAWKEHSQTEVSDASIYNFFRKPEVSQKIIEMGNSLNVYDTVCDLKLLSIINDPKESTRNVILAIKEWNSLRNRIHTNIKIEAIQNIDFSDLTDSGLEKIIMAMNPVQDVEYEEIIDNDLYIFDDENNDIEEYGTQN